MDSVGDQLLPLDDWSHLVLILLLIQMTVGSRHVRCLCLDDLVMALLIVGVSGMDGRRESIVWVLHETASI